MIIVTAPSGTGKTTIVRHLLERFDSLAFSVSATTRTPRPHERHGKDYYFLDTDTFRKHIEQGDFLEWEEVYDGQYYGTLRKEVERLWSQGKNVIFDIDVKGALNLKKAYPDRTLTIFLKPPSLQALEQRLRNRRSETPESLRKRLEKAKLELQFENNFDVVIVNDDLEVAKAEAERAVAQFLK
ncbi:MAG: guanylate kinase [Saprospiraceae bacterium]|nr:MAG: guanylate kinase [Saprospiraceae bacterium]